MTNEPVKEVNDKRATQIVRWIFTIKLLLFAISLPAVAGVLILLGEQLMSAEGELIGMSIFFGFIGVNVAAIILLFFDECGWPVQPLFALGGLFVDVMLIAPREFLGCFLDMFLFKKHTNSDAYLYSKPATVLVAIILIASMLTTMLVPISFLFWSAPNAGESNEISRKNRSTITSEPFEKAFDLERNSYNKTVSSSDPILEEQSPPKIIVRNRVIWQAGQHPRDRVDNSPND